jgi:holo-[acyl-carrier protein] synthase
MITVGLDAVEIERFKHWHTYSHKKLQRIFTAQEIDYCLKDPVKSAERFAVRFAAKEAFYKAFSSLVQTSIPFLTVCKEVEIIKEHSKPPILSPRGTLFSNKSPFTISCSLTHTRTTALAVVILTSNFSIRT